MRIKQLGLSSFLTAAMIVAAPFAVVTPAFSANASHELHLLERQNDGVMDYLKGARFQNVEVSVNGGIVHLTGSVELYADKEEAAKRASRIKDAAAVRNDIQIAGPRVSDDELQAKLVTKVQYDRVGYGTTAFNAISVSVRDGVVTLGGHAYGETDRYSALAVASHMRGVQDLIDEIDVDPVSSMDDRIRIDVARAIYGYPVLTKYAIDPGKPIRISVQNGNVTLFGMVDNQTDKDVANLRANGVGGVFKVTNQLEVAENTSLRK